jgi:hypothetical protein
LTSVTVSQKPDFSGTMGGRDALQPLSQVTVGNLIRVQDDRSERYHWRARTGVAVAAVGKLDL